jgi:hypothetical protein
MNIISEEETVRKRTANTKRIIRVDIGLVSCIRHGVVSQEVIKKTTVCLAQLVERTAFNRMVAGSSPAMAHAFFPERSKGVDLRSTASASWVRIPQNAPVLIAQLVEHRAYDAGVQGSNPCRNTKHC